MLLTLYQNIPDKLMVGCWGGWDIHDNSIFLSTAFDISAYFCVTCFLSRNVCMSVSSGFRKYASVNCIFVTFSGTTRHGRVSVPSHTFSGVCQCLGVSGLHLNTAFCCGKLCISRPGQPRRFVQLKRFPTVLFQTSHC